MNSYIILGAINSIFISISLLGLISQIKTIWHRKSDGKIGTDLLSFNQFSVSFLAYFSFFIYGYSIKPFNHFIVWLRLIAVLMVGLILYEMWRERKNNQAIVTVISIISVFISGLTGLIYHDSFAQYSQLISSALIVTITLLLAQGYWHQILLIVRSQQTGAIDVRMSQFILMMDISTIAFALSMGLANGWPLLFLASVSATTKVIIIHLFYKLNKTDHAKRA